MLVRPPLRSAWRWGWYPCLFGGLGAKRYDFDVRRSHTDFAASVGRGLFSNFTRAGFDDRQRDLIYTGGASISFGLPSGACGFGALVVTGR